MKDESQQTSRDKKNGGAGLCCQLPDGAQSISFFGSPNS